MPHHGYLYDLRWYGSADYVVPLWWIGFTDTASGELDRTEVFHSTNGTGPGALYRWLVGLTDPETAGRLVSSAASVVSQRARAAS